MSIHMTRHYISRDLYGGLVLFGEFSNNNQVTIFLNKTGAILHINRARDHNHISTLTSVSLQGIIESDRRVKKYINRFLGEYRNTILKELI